MNKTVRDANYGRQVRDACMQMIPEAREFLASLNRGDCRVAWSDCGMPRKMTDEEKRRHCGDRDEKQRAKDAARIAANLRKPTP